MTESTNTYRPRVVSLPGETLLEVLDEHGMSQAELAQRMGRPKKTINEIVKGKTTITPETALELERVLRKPSAGFWLRREQEYQESLARLDEERRLAGYDAEIAKWNVPFNELVKRKWVQPATTKIDRTRELLSFFGVATPENWEALYVEPQAKWRRAANVSEKTGKVAAWLRQGELLGQKAHAAPFDKDVFSAALRTIRASLVVKRKLTDILPELARLCAEAGVVVVMVEEFAGAGVNAAARWLSQERALIQISYRYDRLDIFWFNFFHEAGHILLHGKRELFIDDDGNGPDHKVEEAEADRFASDYLIDTRSLRTFLAGGTPTVDDVVRFARTIAVDPSIVVGRLRKIEVVAPAFGSELMVKLGKNAKG
ncbi:MAG: HigA family addiction module antidote protein [Deltaproteobacteria bacterium]|nr:HigA family addiction module antidote protein [Deltaproteobacteria bacterium]